MSQGQTPSTPPRPLIVVMILTTLAAWGAVSLWGWIDFGPEHWQFYIPACLAAYAGFNSLMIYLRVNAFIMNQLLRKKAFQKTNSKGSAGWAEVKQLQKAGLYDTGGVFLGTDTTGKPLFFKGEGHGMVLSPAGGGKTISFVVPNLLHLDLPIIVTDLKGTLACITKKIREKIFKQIVYCLNPACLFPNILGKPARYNPLQILLDAWDSGLFKDIIADARAIAIQLLPEPKNAGENAFFRAGSRKLIVFCIVYVVTRDQPEKATLCEVLHLLRNEKALIDAFYIASCSDILDGELADMANDLLAKFTADDNKRQTESFREGACQVLEVFSPSGHLAESISACDFRFKDLKTRAATVYIIADPSRIEVFRPWIGLICWAAITELTRAQNNKPIMILLDEASNFYINNISNNLTTLREYGLNIYFILQEMEEYARIYGKEALETLLSQSAVKLFMKVQSYNTAELISKLLGERTIKLEQFNLGNTMLDPAQRSVAEAPRRLLTPDEVRQFADTILFVQALPPIWAKKLGYHEVSPWKRWAGINPLHGKCFKGKTKLTLHY
jgi:type IV secretion system protein VirD4